MTESELKGITAHQEKLTFQFVNSIIENSHKLEKGKLKLTAKNASLLFEATSGLPGFQNLESSNQKGRGRIPSCAQAGITNYFVATNPIYLPNVKGVSGNFYPITPFSVSVGMAKRSDLGIHRDANVPGSSGCLVITLEDHWKFFEVEMKKIADRGVLTIPLLVY